jgi:hypothetical protein
MEAQLYGRLPADQLHGSALITEPAAARLLLVCAETGPQRRWLVNQALAALVHQDAGRSILAIDLSGGAAPPPAAAPAPGLDWRAYAGEPWADQIWQQLLPVLQPWWELLDGAAAVAERPGRQEVPGLDAVLRCLFLADQCAGQSTSQDTSPVPHMLVILPPLEQALPMLQLACRGPELLEGLWRPLLQWWSQTRQRLAQFELVLRLRLPSAESLELSERWYGCLEHLAQRLSPAAATAEVLLAVAADAADLGDLGGLGDLGARIAALPLCGLSRLRLWLDADLPDAMAAQVQRQLAIPVLIGNQQRQVLERQHLDSQAWLRQPLPQQTLLWQEGEGLRRCRVHLPGLQREGLQVQRIGQILQIRSAGLRLAVPMPPGWSQLVCRSARIDSPWLAIDFG